MPAPMMTAPQPLGPASENLQGRKPQEMELGGFGVRYGDLIATDEVAERRRDDAAR
jgi:hypothetical protein